MSNSASPRAEYLRAEAWSIRLVPGVYYYSYCSNVGRRIPNLGFAAMADTQPKTFGIDSGLRSPQAGIDIGIDSDSIAMGVANESISTVDIDSR